MLDEFDYIVVGGGSAGCAVAGRLSEDPSLEVALVEAGPEASDPIFQIPGLFWQQQKSSFDWDFQTVPEPGLAGRRAYLPRGRVLGGSSAMNTMLYVRGAAADYDEWAAAGHAGWSFADLLPLFKASEDNSRGESEHHGVGGPLSVEDVASVPEIVERWMTAAQQFGLPANPDFNGASQDGVGRHQATQRGGRRCSSADAFVVPNLGRPNLRVLTRTQALGLEWEGDRVTGVRVESEGRSYLLRHAKELILSAGAYQSPQLLMLSGIGPAEHLREIGIEPRVDNPAVGQGLMDHAGCFLAYGTEVADRSDPDAWTEAGAFVRSGSGLVDPDLQFHAAAGIFADGSSSGADRAMSFGPYVTKPRSRGWVRLRSSLPQAKPLVAHNYLVDEADRRVLRRGVRMALEMARQPALGPVLDHRGAAAAGSAPVSERDEDIDAYMAASAFSFFHPAGTCALGKVVDADFKVLGVEGVRVCDASIMPTLIAGNLNAPAIMFGEKLARSILGPIGDQSSVAERSA